MGLLLKSRFYYFVFATLLIATGCENKGYHHPYIISHQEKDAVEVDSTASPKQ